MRDSAVAVTIESLVHDPLWSEAAQRQPSKLVDLACIDLIQRRRGGQRVSAVDYVNVFAVLAEANHLLDLIDSDLCVCEELGLPSPADDYGCRFPELGPAIMDLVRLQDSNQSDLPFPLLKDDRTVSHESSDFSFDENLPLPPSVNLVEPPPTNEIAAELNGHQGASCSTSDQISVDFRLVDAPSWFVGRQCVAVGPGHWLIRGKDETRGVPLAFKVVRMPRNLRANASHELLDICEAASKVQHPGWVTPIIATVQNQYLGVIRPWWFARGMPRELNFSDQPNLDKAKVALRNLSSVAFAVAAAHQTGATHGAIHSGNILVDHDGKWKLVDAVANRNGVSRYFSGRQGFSVDGAPSIASLEVRKRIDIDDLVMMITGLLFSSSDSQVEEMVIALRRIAAKSNDPAADIGDLLLAFADADCLVPTDQVRLRSPMRKRFSDWMSSKKRSSPESRNDERGKQ
ncbi:hypothetical protein N9N28_11690 [Rubripirellula amarantea]|nr:hypothetical protein [Rubripirellula amarantea]